MIVLGLSGFENPIGGHKGGAVYSRNSSMKEFLDYSKGRIPLQYFPLDLIGHDCSAALVIDGKIAAFASDERFTRIKHGFNLGGQTTFPARAISFCLDYAKVGWDDIDYVAHYCKFDKAIIEKRYENITAGLDPDLATKIRNEYYHTYNNKLSRNVICKHLDRISSGAFRADKLIQVDHHLSHAAGAFYSSDFDEASILTMDGYGELDSACWFMGKSNRITTTKNVALPSSLGMLYQIISLYLGFGSFGDEYKVMGLSSYGDQHRYKSEFEEILCLNNDGTFSTSGIHKTDLLAYLKGLFGEIDSPGGYSQKAADIAAALQKRLEETILHMLSHIKYEHKIRNLCISGGVGLNAAANGAIVGSKLFDKVYFQPAAADDGASLGAALYVCHERGKNKKTEPIRHVFWGPDYGEDEIENTLKRFDDLVWKKEADIINKTARLLADGALVGWFTGRMEMGPRALGARSILADPRSIEIRNNLNSKIKNREQFRPFAPSILQSEASRYFQMNGVSSSPYMIVVFPVIESMRNMIKGVVHVDSSSRVQTVTEEQIPRYFELLKDFYKLTGVPVLLNTSFNRAGEPIVCSPADAVQCFIKCGLDALVIEDYLVFKSGEDRYK